MSKKNSIRFNNQCELENRRQDRIESYLNAIAAELTRMNTMLENMQSQNKSSGKLENVLADLFAELVEGDKVAEMTEDEEE